MLDRFASGGTCTTEPGRDDDRALIATGHHLVYVYAVHGQRAGNRAAELVFLRIDLGR